MAISFAGLVAARLGIVGYFNVAGTGEYFTLYDNSRAMGPFKDPNVYGPFLVPPIVWLCQDLILRRSRPMARAVKARGAAVRRCCSASRAARSSILSLGRAAARPDLPHRDLAARARRTVAIAAVASSCWSAVLIAVALSVPEIRDLALRARDAHRGLRQRRARAVRQSVALDPDAARPAFRLRAAALRPNIFRRIRTRCSSAPSPLSAGSAASPSSCSSRADALFRLAASSFRRSAVQPQVGRAVVGAAAAAAAGRADRHRPLATSVPDVRLPLRLGGGGAGRAPGEPAAASSPRAIPQRA